MRLFYQKYTKSKLVGYANIEYLSYLPKARSQFEYVSTYDNIVISWRPAKQTLTTTSSNHAGLIALYDTD
jgi:hypothetical protein